MKKLLNLTLHTQGEREREIARAAGYDLQAEPMAPMVGPGQEGLIHAGQQLAKLLWKAAMDEAAVLVGGHTGALVYALRLLKQESWPEMVVFETRRERDEHDRFVFLPVGVNVIPAARIAHQGDACRLSTTGVRSRETLGSCTGS